MATAAGTAHSKGTIIIQRQRVLVVDEKNMLPIWLEEKVARHELKEQQALDMLHDQENHGKLWTGPLKDAVGSGKLFFKLARDFASWKGAQTVFTKSRAGHDLVIFKGWPARRKLISGTRYRVDNPKMIEMQIGKPGLKAGAKESARFGIIFVVAVDLLEYFVNDKATLGSLLGPLTVDIPSIMLASAIGAAAGSAVLESATAMAALGAFAFGPLAVAFVVGVGVGLLLYEADQYFHISETLGKLYDKAIEKLAEAWHALGREAEDRYHLLANSQMVHDLRQDAHILAERIARQADWVRGELAHLW